MANLSGGSAPLGIPSDLWDVLACPCPEHAAVEADEATGQVVCTRCQTRFDVRDGVPVMLLDDATAGPNGVGAPSPAAG